MLGAAVGVIFSHRATLFGLQLVQCSLTGVLIGQALEDFDDLVVEGCGVSSVRLYPKLLVKHVAVTLRALNQTATLSYCILYYSIAHVFPVSQLSLLRPHVNREEGGVHIPHLQVQSQVVLLWYIKRYMTGYQVVSQL